MCQRNPYGFKNFYSLERNPRVHDHLETFAIYLCDVHLRTLCNKLGRFEERNLPNIRVRKSGKDVREEIREKKSASLMLFNLLSGMLELGKS